jgi:hypothetical protein
MEKRKVRKPNWQRPCRYFKVSLKNGGKIGEKPKQSQLERTNKPLKCISTECLTGNYQNTIFQPIC